MEIDPESKKHLTLRISSACEGTTVFCQVCVTMCTTHILIKTGEKKKIKIYIAKTVSCRVVDI